MTAPGFVYFLKPIGRQGPVKIGWSGQPERRLQQAEPYSPDPLEIVATIAGSQQLERRFHALLRDDHYRYEWFHATSAVLDVIAAINMGGFDIAALPPGCVIYQDATFLQAASERANAAWARRRKKAA